MTDDELGPLTENPDLSASGAAMREEWRADEEMYAHEARTQWEHGRRLVDIFTELMHRGDVVAIAVDRASFTGTVIAVGDDLVSLHTPSGRVDLRTALPSRVASDRHALVPAPMLVRVVERAKAGGTRPAGPSSFRARLHELEMDGAELVVGCPIASEELRGALVLGRDHLRVRDGAGGETYVPLAWVSYVMPWRP